jgi:molybdenum cofactor synthesis domain-containing protein
MRLLEKQGGKSDHSKGVAPSISAAVIVCSDSIAAGKNEDRAGKSIIGRLERIGVKVADYLIIPDEIDPIRSQLTALVEKEVRLIIFTGGTGLSKRDVTPEAIRPLLERTIPGIEEVMRDYGQERMPYAMLSRSVAGMIGDTLVLALPGSTKGAEESMDAIFPQVLHLFRVLDSLRHEEA